MCFHFVKRHLVKHVTQSDSTENKMNSSSSTSDERMTRHCRQKTLLETRLHDTADKDFFCKMEHGPPMFQLLRNDLF